MEDKTYIDYAKFVRQVSKPGADIIASLTPEKAELWHMATLISGEAGELADAIKKYVIYGKALDLHNIQEEHGDLEFGLQGVRNILHLDRQVILDMNYTKLKVRYPNGYSNAAAIARADKS